VARSCESSCVRLPSLIGIEVQTASFSVGSTEYSHKTELVGITNNPCDFDISCSPLAQFAYQKRWGCFFPTDCVS
jgi:hypothetical protein